MIKKNIGVALLVASVAVMGCSSDDDDATPAATAGATDATATDAGATDATATDAGATDATATDAGATDATATDAGATDATATDAGATDATATDAGAADAGATDSGATDGGASGPEYNANSIMGVMAADARLTSIAAAMNPNFDQPLDTAGQNWTVFAPTNDAIAAAVAAGAEVTNVVLQSHIYTQGAVASTDLSVGQTVSMSNNSVYTITAGENGGLLINGIAIIEADLAVDNGALHVIDGVLLPQ